MYQDERNTSVSKILAPHNTKDLSLSPSVKHREVDSCGSLVSQLSLIRQSLAKKRNKLDKS